MTTKQKEIIKTIQQGVKKGCRLVNFTYVAKESKEEAEHTILLNVDLMRAYRRDRSVICGKMAHLKGLKLIAAQELLTSLNNSIRMGIGNNPDYKCRGVFVRISTGIKMCVENNELIIFGFSLRRRVIKEGDYPDRKSKPITIEKNKLRKLFKSKRFRLYSLSNILSARLEGKTIVLKTRKEID